VVARATVPMTAWARRANGNGRAESGRVILTRAPEGRSPIACPCARPAARSATSATTRCHRRTSARLPFDTRDDDVDGSAEPHTATTAARVAVPRARRCMNPSVGGKGEPKKRQTEQRRGRIRWRVGYASSPVQPEPEVVHVAYRDRSTRKCVQSPARRRASSVQRMTSTQPASFATNAVVPA